MKILKKIKSLFWGDEPLKGGSAIFVVLCVISTIALLISNIVANKNFKLFDIVDGNTITTISLTCGVIVFPISYITSDIASQNYGYSASRRINWLGFAANLLMVIMFWIADAIPAVVWQGDYQDAFHTVLGVDWTGGWGVFGTLSASLLAYIFGSWVDDVVFEKMKNRAVANNTDGDFKFGLRAIVSSFAGEIVDSCIFLPLLFLCTSQFGFQGGSTITVWYQLPLMILIQASIKTCYELIVIPFTVMLSKKISKYEDSHTNKEKIN